jgi:hypothetical protein
VVLRGPDVWQLGGLAAHAPLAQNGVLEVQETALPHWPHASHVCTPLPEHCVAFGVHTGADGQEQAPQAQLEVHVWVP